MFMVNIKYDTDAITWPYKVRCIEYLENQDHPSF